MPPTDAQATTPDDIYEGVNSPSQVVLLDPTLSSPVSPASLGAGSPKGLDDLEEGEGDGSPVERHEPSANFTSCSINLLKTILGAGMLAMPAAFASLGYIPGILFILVAGGLASFGLHLFVASSQYIGRGATVNRLANLTYPQMSTLFDFAVALKCFGVAASYLIVIGDTCGDIVKGLGYESGPLVDRRSWLLITAFIMVPLAFLRHMDSLKYTSFAGLLSVVYLVGVAVWNYLKPEAFRPPPNAAIEAFSSYSFAALKSFAVFVFSFTCHQNREAIDNSSAFMNRVVNFCVGLSSLIYLVFSVVAYANFGKDIKGNILNYYPIENIEIIIARCLFALLAVFSYPLQTLPCRNSFEHLLPITKSTKKSHANTIHIALTSFILLGTFTFAFALNDLSLVSSIIGTVAGIPICYILPFVFYYKLTEGRGWTWKRVAAGCLAAFGVVAMAINSIAIVIDLLYPDAN